MRSLNLALYAGTEEASGGREGSARYAWPCAQTAPEQGSWRPLPGSLPRVAQRSHLEPQAFQSADRRARAHPVCGPRSLRLKVASRSNSWQGTRKGPPRTLFWRSLRTRPSIARTSLSASWGLPRACRECKVQRAHASLLGRGGTCDRRYLP